MFFVATKYDYVIKIREMFSFLPVIDNSVSNGLRFLLLLVSAMISSKTINTLHFLLGLHSLIFL